MHMADNMADNMADKMSDKPTLQLTLAKPRGFCAGVDRAVLIVEQALAQFGAPVFVRHEIVHNKRVVDRLRGLAGDFLGAWCAESRASSRQCARAELARCDLPIGL